MMLSTDLVRLLCENMTVRMTYTLLLGQSAAALANGGLSVTGGSLVATRDRIPDPAR